MSSISIELTLQQQLINQASELIDRFSFDKELKKCTLEYINYKFNQSINFSCLTAIHYDIFRAESNEEEKVNIQTIVELVLLASDIMDDLQDGDSGDNPWANIDLGYNLNIIISLLLICLEKIEDIQSANSTIKWIRTKIHQSILEAINGQHIDLTNQISSESDYISMVSLKSGALIKMACILGAGNTNKDTLNIIETYSSYLGIIAQTRNDVNDMINGFMKNDIVTKKRTLPILYYLRHENPKFQIIKDYYLGNQSYNEMSDQEISSLHELLIYGGAVEYCKVLQQLYVYKYKECIYSLNLDKQAEEQLLNIKI
ncbi:polyprenyl synthetase family protein [Metabacillus fastidiosus]|uniref:polyprenyl synthetase family protein n=1 Tax=Metabacillus fastidiosus TaxID=1458 RepID=UPI003D2B14BE